MSKKIDTKGKAITLMGSAVGELREELAKNVPPAEVLPKVGKRNRSQNN